MLRLAFDFIIAWRETRTRPNAYTVFIVNDLKLVTGKVNVYLVIGIMLNMPHDMSHHPVTHEIITETGMFVSIRACFVILFVQGFDRYPSAAKTGGVLG